MRQNLMTVNDPNSKLTNLHNTSFRESQMIVIVVTSHSMDVGRQSTEFIEIITDIACAYHMLHLVGYQHSKTRYTQER